MRGEKRYIRFRIAVLFTAIVMAEILATVGIASLLSGLLDFSGVSASVWLWVFSVLIGGVLAWYVNRAILNPITHLSEAMDKVAAGDYTVTLHSNNRMREIKNIYDKFILLLKIRWRVGWDFLASPILSMKKE